MINAAQYFGCTTHNNISISWKGWYKYGYLHDVKNPKPLPRSPAEEKSLQIKDKWMGGRLTPEGAATVNVIFWVPNPSDFSTGKNSEHPLQIKFYLEKTILKVARCQAWSGDL